MHINGHSQIWVERRRGKVCHPKTDVLPLCHATNRNNVFQTSDSLTVNDKASLKISRVGEFTQEVCLPELNRRTLDKC